MATDVYYTYYTLSRNTDVKTSILLRQSGVGRRVLNLAPRTNSWI